MCYKDDTVLAIITFAGRETETCRGTGRGTGRNRRREAEKQRKRDLKLDPSAETVFSQELLSPSVVHKWFQYY